MSWQTKRTEEYTEKGIKRLKCIRCGEPASRQWQICSDGNNFRPICNDCDIKLNAVVLKFMKHPRAKKLMWSYKYE